VGEPLSGRAVVVLLAVACAFLAAGCGQREEEIAPPAGARITTIPQADGGSVDLAVDRAGGLHLVWARGSRDTAETFYQFSPDGGESWSNPTLITKGSVVGRIFACDSTLHIVSDLGIHHFSSHDHGHSWSEREPLIGVVYGGADQFDGCCFGDTLLLAYLENDFRDSVACMKVARFSGDHEIDRRTIGTTRYRGLSFHQPRICESKGQFWLVSNVTSSIDDEVREAGSVVHSRRGRMTVTVWSSADHGAHWTSHSGPQIDGDPPPTLPIRASAKGELQLAVVQRGISVLKGDRDDWSSGGSISSLGGPPWMFLGPERNIDAATEGRTAVVAWVDGRHNWGTWNWRGFFKNPSEAKYLGMDYMNNDVFVVIDQDEFRVPSRPIRLTKEPAMVSNNLRVAIRGNEAIILWPGRAEVGKHADAYGSPQHIFLARIPLTGN
jgi:hypothetical protein